MKKLNNTTTIKNTKKATEVKIPNMVIESCKIVFRNFSGNETNFNAAGRRNFAILLPDDIADQMAESGWNIKWLNPREAGDPKQAYIKVSVNYGKVQPKITVITSHGHNMLDADTVGMLDWAEISNVDVILSPYAWEVSGKHGIKAYLKTMFVTIVEDELTKKYGNPNVKQTNQEDGED